MTTKNYQLIKSLAYFYQYGRKQYAGYKTYNIDWWDGRTMIVKELKQAGISRQDAAAILQTIVKRRQLSQSQTDTLTQAERLAFIKMVNECTFDMNVTSSRYNRTGIDYKAFHRPASSGGWVLIAPDEPGNNWHTKDPIVVKYLTQKYCPVS